tara:strand:+ start:44 stop:292 length:249 start_codon:yes stop_codon:yes gene_type:complete
MAKQGRKKNYENMQPWEQAEHDRRIAMGHMRKDQLEAVEAARSALLDFEREWSESYDLNNADIPRKLQAAFWSIYNAFPKED